MTSERPFAELVAIGRLLRPQGRKGEVLTEPLSDQPARFASLKAAYVPAPGGGSRRIEISDCWPHKGRFVLKIAGVDSIDEAEAYRGLELRIGEEELVPLPDGSYYFHQLRGLQVDGGAAGALGHVADVLETGGEAVVLVVKGEAGETLIPLAAPFVNEVDLAAGRMRVTLLPEYADGGGARR